MSLTNCMYVCKAPRDTLHLFLMRELSLKDPGLTEFFSLCLFEKQVLDSKGVKIFVLQCNWLCYKNRLRRHAHTVQQKHTTAISTEDTLNYELTTLLIINRSIYETSQHLNQLICANCLSFIIARVT